MQYLWIFTVLCGFVLFVNPTLFAEGLEQRNNISVIKNPSLAQTEQITSKIWLITSNEFGCSSKNQKAMEWLQSISFVYFSLYGIKSEFDTLQCLHINQIENDPDYFLFSIQNYDLPILVFDSEPYSHIFSKENNHHYQIVGYEKPHIVLCYCAIPAPSHTTTWELSHQLSHFILDAYGENSTVSQDWVHDAESESVKCVNIRRQPGLCSDKWTPVFGNFPKEMMSVKIHPNYFHELDSIKQLLISQEQNKKNKSESQDKVQTQSYTLKEALEIQKKRLGSLIKNDSSSVEYDYPVELTAEQMQEMREIAQRWNSTPLKQVQVFDVEPHNVNCKTGLELILKKTIEKPACVKPETAMTLITRGWGEK